MECDKNGVDGMCHLGVSQLIIVYKIQFSVRDGWVKFKVSVSQTFDEEKARVFCSEIYGLQEQMSVTDFSRMARPKSEQDLHD